MAESESAFQRQTPADAINTEIQYCLTTGGKVGKAVFDYVEAPGGTRCATCRFAVRLDPELTGWQEDVAECAVMFGKISLKDGCCAAWKADENQLVAVAEGVKTGG